MTKRNRTLKFGFIRTFLCTYILHFAGQCRGKNRLWPGAEAAQQIRNYWKYILRAKGVQLVCAVSFKWIDFKWTHAAYAAHASRHPFVHSGPVPLFTTPRGISNRGVCVSRGRDWEKVTVGYQRSTRYNEMNYHDRSHVQAGTFWETTDRKTEKYIREGTWEVFKVLLIVMKCLHNPLWENNVCTLKLTWISAY